MVLYLKCMGSRLYYEYKVLIGFLRMVLYKNIWSIMLIFGYWRMVLNFKFFDIALIYRINKLDWILTHGIEFILFWYYVDILNECSWLDFDIWYCIKSIRYHLDFLNMWYWLDFDVWYWILSFLVSRWYFEWMFLIGLWHMVLY